MGRHSRYADGYFDDGAVVVRGAEWDAFHPELAHPERTAVVHVADVLCRAESFGNGGDRRIPLLQPAALRLLGLGMVEVEAVMNQMDRGLRDIPRVQPGL